MAPPKKRRLSPQKPKEDEKKKDSQGIPEKGEKKDAQSKEENTPPRASAEKKA